MPRPTKPAWMCPFARTRAAFLPLLIVFLAIVAYFAATPAAWAAESAPTHAQASQSAPESHSVPEAPADPEGQPDLEVQPTTESPLALEPQNTPESRGELTLDDISARLERQLETAFDVIAQVKFVQIAADGSKNEGILRLEAIFPDLVRATWIKPEIYEGVFFILDFDHNTYTEYIPATGEAFKHPLDQILDQQSPIPLRPQQFFSLPSTTEFDLSLTGVDHEEGYAAIQAVERATGRVYDIRVDTERWLATRIEGRTPDGRVEYAEAFDIQINQDLNAASLRLLPPGTVERSYP